MMLNKTIETKRDFLLLVITSIKKNNGRLLKFKNQDKKILSKLIKENLYLDKMTKKIIDVNEKRLDVFALELRQFFE